MAKDSWNNETYSQFLDLRTRPARDLLAAIPNSIQPQLIYDLGCGPGNSTILLKDRWPKATVIGTDSSENMLQQATAAYPGIQFIHEDIAHFAPKNKANIIFSNAALQWVNAHEQLIPSLCSHLQVGGYLAIQMPNNFHMPSHQITIQVLEENPAWHSILQYLRYGKLNTPLYQTHFYYDLLANENLTNITLWQTDYIQVMDNHQAIFNWAKGTGLRPVLNNLDKASQQSFKQQYIAELQKQYPTQEDGKVLFAFKRLFMVAQKT